MINFKNLPAVPKAFLAEEQQILRQYPPTTPCDIILPLKTVKKAFKTQGNIRQNLELDKLLFKGKMAALIEILNSRMNIFLDPKEQKIAEKVVEQDFREAFGVEMRKIIAVPDNYLHDIETELLNEGELESKHFKKVFNSKACKRYAQTARALDSCRLKMAELSDIIAEKEQGIIELKKQYNMEKDIEAKNELAQKVNQAIDESSKFIKEYNRLLTLVYAPKVAAMRQDAKIIEQHLREVKGVDYVLPLEAIIGKTPKSPRDKSYNIIV